MRNEALQKVVTILGDAKFITPQLGELPAALAARMSDSNSNLVQQSLVIGQTLAVAMAGDPELAAEDVRLAARALDRITGRIGPEDVLDRIFATFCIGK